MDETNPTSGAEGASQTADQSKRLTDQAIALFQDGTWLDYLVPFAINLCVAIAIFIIGAWVIRRLMAVLTKFLNYREVDPTLISFLRGLVGTVLKFVLVLLAVEQLGIDTTSLLALLGAAGLAIGLALKDSLSNFASGVMLILFKPFRVGHYVEIADTSGIVDKITIFNTILHSPDNKEITVPNGQVYGSTIVNYSAHETRRVDLVMGIGYDDDMRQARELIKEVLDSCQYVLDEPAPNIGVNELGDSSVNIVVRPWVKASNFWPAKWELTEALKYKFDEAGITIPYPQRDVHIIDNSSTAADDETKSSSS